MPLILFRWRLPLALCYKHDFRFFFFYFLNLCIKYFLKKNPPQILFHSPTLNRACIIPNLFPPSSWSLKERPIRMSAPTCEPQRSSPFPPRFFFPLITRKNSSTPVTCYKFSLSDHVHPIAFRHGSRWIGTDFLGFCFFFWPTTGS